MTPRISVITATHNAAQFIDRTAACVLEQTFGDLEWVVVDDASADGTADRVEALGDPRVHVLRRTTGGGPSAARNTGLARARGELIGFLDHDDIWFPERAQRLVAAFDAQPGLGFASTDMYNGDPESGGGLTILGNPECRDADLAEARTWLKGCGFSASTMMVRAEALRRHGAWDERLWFAQDWELALRLWLAGEPATMLPEPLGWTVQRPGQLSEDVGGLFADRVLVLGEVARTHADSPIAIAAADQRREWCAGEALARLGMASELAATDPRAARTAARRALRLPLAPAARAAALGYAVAPRWTRGAGRTVRALRAGPG